jgi:hypothetical protein
MNTLLLDLERVALEDDKAKVMRLLKSIAECTGMKMEYLIKRMKEAQMSELGRCDNWDVEGNI